MPKTVSDIMTRRVLVLTEEENLERIDEGMKRYGLRHLPVVDDGKLVGLISQRDILRVSVSTLDPNYDERNEKLKQNTFVSQVMTRDVATVHESTELKDAARALVDRKFGSLPVVDDDGMVVGIVTELDFIKLALEMLGGEVPKRITNVPPAIENDEDAGDDEPAD